MLTKRLKGYFLIQQLVIKQTLFRADLIIQCEKGTQEPNDFSDDITTITTLMKRDRGGAWGEVWSQNKGEEHGETLTMVQEEVSKPALRHTVITTNCDTQTCHLTSIILHSLTFVIFFVFIQQHEENETSRDTFCISARH